MGFDFDAGRVDTVAINAVTYPLGAGDCRLGMSYDETDFSTSFLFTVHEVGHGLHEQGMDPGTRYLPNEGYVPFGILESQSRIWENQVARQKAFWEKWLPIAEEYFPDLKKKNLTPEQVYNLKNRVEPTHTRVGADPICYLGQIVIRAKLEMAMMKGELKPKDLPEAWKAAYEKIGATVPDDLKGGCLQDPHWSGGAIGYFPAYALGDLRAAQLITAAHRQDPQLQHQINNGNYAPLATWLRENVHTVGATCEAEKLMTRITGCPTDPRDYLSFLRQTFCGETPSPDSGRGRSRISLPVVGGATPGNGGGFSL